MSMTEAQFQRQVEDLCAWLHLETYHTHDSRRSNPGFPDLMIVGGGSMMLRELKTDVGRVAPMQKYWMEILTAAGVDADIWRPRDMPRIKAELQAMSRVQIQKPKKPVKKARKQAKPAPFQRK